MKGLPRAVSYRNICRHIEQETNLIKMLVTENAPQNEQMDLLVHSKKKMFVMLAIANSPARTCQGTYISEKRILLAMSLITNSHVCAT